MLYSMPLKPFFNFCFFPRLKEQGSAASEMEMDRLKLDHKRSMQMVQQWKKTYENLHQFCVNELLEDGAEARGPI